MPTAKTPFVRWMPWLKRSANDNERPVALRDDFGATHGDKSGKDTMLRNHWNNQTTGIVNDEVFELKMEPANWGEITFP